MYLPRLSLWVVPHLLLVMCLVGLVRKGLYRQFPFFFSYVAIEEAQFVLCFVTDLLTLRVRGLLEVYRWIVVAGIPLSSCLQIAVLYEVSRTLISQESRVSVLLRPVMRWTIAVLVLLASVIAAMFSESGLQRVIHAFEALDFSANLINLGVLLVLLAFTRSLNISWKRLSAGIVLGFGIASSAEMGATSFISALGVRGIIPSDVVRMAGFLACTLVWLVYIFLPEKQPVLLGREVQKSEIESWSEELTKMVKR